MRKYSIGEVASALDVSVQAIRLYQKLGLITPVEINEKTGYRYFDDQAMMDIWRIKVMQSAGFELKEIKGLENKELSEITSLIKKRKHDLGKEILQKKLALKYLERQLKGIELWQQDTAIELRYIENRYGHSFGSVKRNLFDHIVELNNVEGVVGVNQEVAHLPSRRLKYVDGEMQISDLFAINRKFKEGLAVQEAGWYLCTFSKDRSRRRDSYKKLFKHANEKGYRLRGDAIEIIVMNNLVTDGRYSLTEIQLAIEFD